MTELDFQDSYDPDNYDGGKPLGSASIPASNPTLNLLVGNDDSALYSPASVAKDGAAQYREESLRLWEEVAKGAAGRGVVPEVEIAVNEMNRLRNVGETSYTDDVEEIADGELEKLIALVQFTGEKPREEAIRDIKLYSKNIALRSALEASLMSLPQRGAGAQLAQDLFGVTTAVEWGRLTPVLNEELEKFGASPSLTRVGSVEEFFKVVNGLEEKDAVKLISNLTDRLVDANFIPLETSRRFFETALNLQNESKALEGVFGALDALGIGLILKGAAKGLLRASGPISTARAMGAERIVVDEAGDLLITGKEGRLKISQDDAIRMSLNAHTDELLAGLSAPLQKTLRERLEGMRKAMDETIAAGGVKAAELASARAHWERVYSREANSALIESKVVENAKGGNVSIDALYGRRDGSVFATPEEALAYWRPLLAGQLDVVPIAGEVADVARKMESLSIRANTLLKEIDELSKASKKSGVRWAEDIGNFERPTSTLIQEVGQKIAAGQTLDTPLEKRIGALFEKNKGDIEKVALDIQKSVPASIGNKLRELEEVVAEKIAATTGPKRPGYAIRQRAAMPVRLEDLKGMDQDELDSLSLVAGRLNPRLATATTLYKDTLVASLRKTKFAREWADFVSKSFDKIDAKSTDKVIDAIVQTEKLKREMTEAELEVMAKLYTKEEKEAYYAYRLMRREQWAAKNEAMRMNLAAKGFRSVFSALDDFGTFSGPAKLEEDWRPFLGKQLLDAEKNTFVRLTEENIHALKARGLSLYDFAKHQEVPNHKSTATKVLLPAAKTTVGDLKQVVGRVDGAYSRIYMEEYFIKIRGQMFVDNELTDVKYAFRTAATEADAAQYVQKFNELLRMGRVTVDDVHRIMGAYEDDAQALADAINSGKFANSQATFNYTRLDDNFFRDVTGIGGSDKSEGRVFWSQRSEEGIKSISVGSKDSVTAGPLASLEREIGNTAMFVGMEEWRRNVIQRWYNTFEDVISPIDKRMAKTADDVFFNVVNRAKEYALTDARTNTMMAQTRFIVNQLNVRTLDEQLLQHNVNKLSRFADDMVGKVPALSHLGGWMRRTDLVEWVKGKASTLMLGLFSPAQLIVQASGALNATAMSPKHGVRSFYSLLPVLAALNSDNGRVWSWLHKTLDVAKYTGMKSDEFARHVQAIRRSGLVDNIGASSMYSAEDGANNIFGRRMRNFNRYQMGFFNTGEEISRVIAFDIAKREWLEANPGKLWDADDALKNILLRADDLTVNMLRVNEARYAKGLAGIPLQFLQHNIRLGTSMYAGMKSVLTGKKQALSAADAMRLYFGSVLLYGINNTGTLDFVEEALGEATKDWDSDYKLLVGHGIIATGIDQLSQFFTGEEAKLAIGARLSSLQWYEDVYDGLAGIFMDGEIEASLFTGPSGSVLVNMYNVGKLGLDWFDRSSWTTSDFLATLSAMAGTMATSWNNAEKAWYAAQWQNWLENRRGDKTAVLTTPEVIWQALGISSVEASESGYAFKNNQQHQRMLRKMADYVMRQQQAARRAYVNNDTAAQQAALDAIATQLAPLSPSDIVAVKRMARERSRLGDSTIGEAMSKWAAEMRPNPRILIGNEGNEQGTP